MAVAAVLLIGGTSIAAAQQSPAPRAKPSASKPAAPAAAPSGKSVCVATALGNQFNVQRVGLMVFGNALDKVPVEWGIDDAAVRKIQEILGSEYAVRRIPVPLDALRVLETQSSGFFGNRLDDFVKAVAAGAPKCQFYVTLTRGVSPVSGTNQAVAGIGILDHNTGLLRRVYVYASYVIRLHDANLTALQTESPTTDPMLVRGLTGGLRAMYRSTDDSWVPATPQAAAQSAQLKNTARALVEEGLAKKVGTMFEDN